MVQENSNIYKEVFITLSCFSNDLIDKIPNNVLEKIADLSLDSNENVYINKDKSLKDQNISEESKDLISLIYYNYIASDKEKEWLFKLWNENENSYQERLKKEYDIDNLFKHKERENTKTEDTSSSNIEMIEYKKETWFSKFRNFIKKILKK